MMKKKLSEDERDQSLKISAFGELSSNRPRTDGIKIEQA